MLAVTDLTTEGSSRFFTASPKSPTGDPAPPLTAMVKIICLTTNTVIRDWTSNSVTGNDVDITVTDDENQLVDVTNTKEKRRVLVKTTFGVGDAFEDYADFTIVRADQTEDPNALL